MGSWLCYGRPGIDLKQNLKQVVNRSRWIYSIKLPFLSVASLLHQFVTPALMLHFLAYIVRKLGNFRYILIPEIINKFMINISDPVRTKHVHVFKLNLK
jgi:hypothetical protein